MVIVVPADLMGSLALYIFIIRHQLDLCKLSEIKHL